eukprot:NODE_3433_length_1353_cov_28.429268_g2995_i0.p1 GENE.NODE_3433_length_1353_cov_28.429268_g2995_i0~~NODE_3433_length_1353_cov_28.429268_g2995_i0.p1  ORF type:complete len:413 (+),score=95.88 NODE_3433_length_1353_cov_28.429268_g2995_i0:127-1239(+)
MATMGRYPMQTNMGQRYPIYQQQMHYQQHFHHHQMQQQYMPNMMQQYSYQQTAMAPSPPIVQPPVYTPQPPPTFTTTTITPVQTEPKVTKKLPDWLKDSLRTQLAKEEEEPKKRPSFTEKSNTENEPDSKVVNELDEEDLEHLDKVVKTVVTHVLLDVTNIMCKDIAREVIKEHTGRDPFEEPPPVEKPEVDPEPQTPKQQIQTITPDSRVRKINVPVDLIVEPPPEGLYELHLYNSNIFQAVIVCAKPIILLGRDLSSDFQDPHGSVSRQHSAVMFSDRCAYLVDLDSTSGTYLCGKTKLIPRKPYKLNYGDYFTQGKQSYNQYKLAAPKKDKKDEAPIVRKVKRTRMVKKKVMQIVKQKKKKKKKKKK